MRLFAAILEEVVGWTKKPKKKKSPLDKGRIAAWNTAGPKKKIGSKYIQECGCLPDCACKE